MLIAAVITSVFITICYCQHRHQLVKRQALLPMIIVIIVITSMYMIKQYL